MQSAAKKVNKASDRSHTLWLFVVILAILVTVTASLLGSSLYHYVHRSNCVISLSQGTVEPEKAGVGNQTSSPQSTQVEQLSAQEAQKYGLSVTDNTRVWSTTTPIELFSHSYKNADGQITVQSDNADKVIAPGTEGKYTFSLKNTGSEAADYKVWVETEVSSTLTGLSLQARMSGADGWLLGGTDSWEQMNGLDGVYAEEHLESGKSADYTIYWQWPFEMNPEETDTALGNTTADQELSWQVTVYTVAVSAIDDSNSGANGSDSGKKPSSIFAAVKTGDISSLALWSTVAILAAAIVVIAVVLAKRKKENN